MNIVIRECESSDFAAIHKLNTEEMGYDYPFGETEKKLTKLLCSESDKIFVALLDSELIGYVHACDYDVIYAPHMKNIMGIAVASEHKRKGAGKALLEAVESWAKSTDAAGVRLNSGATREGAHAFYRSCGYSGEKTQVRFTKML